MVESGGVGEEQVLEEDDGSVSRLKIKEETVGVDFSEIGG